jgi:hypothetical protein
MIIRASWLKIVVAIGLILTGFQIQLEFDSCNRFQQHRAAARRSTAETTASGAETSTVAAALRKKPINE